MIRRAWSRSTVRWTALAAAGIVLSLVFLKYLPAPFVWIFALWALLLLSGAWFTRGRTAVAAVLVSASVVLVTLALIEVYFQTAPEHEWTYSGDYRIWDDTLGVKPIPGVAVRATHTYGSRQIYDVTYTMGSDGLRLSPPSTQTPPAACVLVFGDSFTYGEGVEDEQTMPYLLGARSRGAYRVFNFGYHGYGPHQMLAALEEGIVDALVDCNPDYVIYQAIPEHLARASSLTAFGRHAPRYVLQPSGSVDRAGNLDDEEIAERRKRPPLAAKLHDRLAYQLSKLKLLGVFSGRDPAVTEHDLALFAAIVKKAEGIVSKKFPRCEFHVLLWPGHLDEQVRQRLESVAVKVHPAGDILPDLVSNRAAYALDHEDGHPSPFAHSMLAYYVQDGILKTGRKGAGSRWRHAAFPLKVSADGRHLVDRNDVPFFMNGDTAWSLIGQLDREDVELYLKDSATKGINSIIVTLVEKHYADNAPANHYGVQPFTRTNRFTSPNEAYFAHADWVIHKAAEYGIQIVLAPMYLGCCNDGWHDALRDDNTEADARRFGEWLGNRYKDFPNLMYVWGNDLNPSSDVRTKIRAMAQAVKDADASHLHTYHAKAENSSLDQWSSKEVWLDVNSTYTYQPVQVKSLLDYHRQAFLPFFLFESKYEDVSVQGSARRARTQAYVAILSGASGHHYGNEPLWHMNGNPGDHRDTWRSHLEAEGRADLPHIRALFESRDWYKLVPDEGRTVVTGGYGTGEHYLAAALTKDRATLIAYFPDQRPVTVNMGEVSGRKAQAWWFNPRDGVSRSAGVYPTAGSQCFVPPTDADWVLVIDDLSRGFPAPGGTAAVDRHQSRLR